jgi:hypothetical protein
MSVLHKLAVKYASDKAEHGFCDFYDDMLGGHREETTHVLEIGIKDGASHHVWLEYFPNAVVCGMDMGFEGDKNLWPDSERFKPFIGNQGRVTHLYLMTQKLGGEYDLVIDDGGHTMWQQQLSFAFLWPLVKPGGWYIIEDLHTSLHSKYGADHAPETTLEMVERLIALGMNGVIFRGSDDDITAIFHKSSA